MLNIHPSWIGWVIGVCIYVVGRSSMALGANLQRYSMRKEEMKLVHERKPKKKQKVLIFGIVLYTTSGIFLSAALLFAPQTLLAPCGSIIFVSNAIFANLLNGEKFNCRNDGPLVLLIAAGVTLCVYSAPKYDEDRPTDELIALVDSPRDEERANFNTPSFVAFLIGISCSIIFLFLTKRRMLLRLEARGGGEHVHSRVGSSSSSSSSSSGGGKGPALSGGGGVGYSSYDSDYSGGGYGGGYRRRRSVWYYCLCGSTDVDVLNLSYGALAGCFGGLNITLTKSIFSLIIGEWSSHGPLAVLKSPLLWLIGLVLGASFVLQLKCTTDALEKCGAMVFVPVQSVTEETVAVLGGLLYFQDYTQFSPWRAEVFSMGIFFSFVGVLALTRLQLRSTQNSAPLEDAESILASFMLDVEAGELEGGADMDMDMAEELHEFSPRSRHTPRITTAYKRADSSTNPATPRAMRDGDLDGHAHGTGRSKGQEHGAVVQGTRHYTDEDTI